jgi:16S rRNA (cytosine967-C5)-methyltransferase
MKSAIPRDLALRALNSPNRRPGFAERYLEKSFRQEPRLDGRDRAFAVHLVQGVLRWRLRLDWIIEQAVRFPFKEIEPPILNILRLALYQIFFMDRVPESAAVNEAVKQATAEGRRHLAGFVNGILRNICRRKDQIAFPDAERDRVRYLSVFHSYPAWIVEKWIRELGIDSTERLLAAGNRIPDLVIRTNSLKVDRTALIKRLEKEGIIGKTTRYSPDGLRIEGLGRPISELSAFQEGLFQVQDEAAQVCSHLLCPKPGDSVLDICAGLGGKTTHLAELLKDKGRIVALDINHGRLVRLSKNSERLGIGYINAVVADAGADTSFLFNVSFDKILVDGPCSGLGVISRHPDGKWNKREDDVKELARLQIRILDTAVNMLRKGGRLLYVTCTISRDENDQVIDNFLEKNMQMALMDLKAHIPSWGHDLIDDRGFFRTFPHIHGMDGFFGALFVKKVRCID